MMSNQAAFLKLFHLLSNFLSMITTAIKTPLIKKGDNLFEAIRNSIPKIKEKSVLVVTSKIVSLCQRRIIKRNPKDKLQKQKIVRQEADYFLDPHLAK